VKVKRIQDRVDRLEPNPPAGDDQERWNKVVSRLSQDEREALSHLLLAAENLNHGDVEDDAWLVTRPQDQQAVVSRVRTLFQEMKPIESTT
jgi:hypothetical protein